jgi:hypothetical protein
MPEADRMWIDGPAAGRIIHAAPALTPSVGIEVHHDRLILQLHRPPRWWRKSQPKTLKQVPYSIRPGDAVQLMAAGSTWHVYVNDNPVLLYAEPWWERLLRKVSSWIR